MGEIARAFATDLRDYEVANVPASTRHNPEKASFRAIGALIEDKVRKRRLIDLPDCPDSYGGKAGYVLRVKADETGLEFVAVGTAPPPVTARRWRARVTIGHDATYWGVTDFRFMSGVGETTQPGTGTAASSTPAAGSAGDAFDGSLSTEWATAIAGGAGYLEFDFDNPQAIGAVYYRARGELALIQAQSPVHMVIEYYNGAAWTLAADIPGILPWDPYEERTFPVPYPGDEDGGHRYWSINVSGTYGATLWSSSEVEFLQGGVNIAPHHDAVLASPGFTDAINLFEGSGTAFIGNSASLPAFAGVDFGRKRVVDQVAITARTGGFLTQFPKDWTLRYSDDGSTWSVAATVTDAGALPAEGERRVYL